MDWNITTEIVAAILVAIIIINSQIGYLLPNFRNVVFQGLLYCSLASIGSNIISSTFLMYYDNVPYFINYTLLIIYFISTAFIGVLYFIYTMSNIFIENKKRLILFTKISFIPILIFSIIVLTNPFTNAIFYLDYYGGYQQGPLVYLSFILFYIYVVLSLMIVVHHKKELDKSISRILIVFPIISGLAIIIQYLNPNFIISGIVIAFVLLLIYLYIQHRQMFTDPLTNLLNRQEFRKMADVKELNGEPFITLVISLKDFKIINDTYGLKTGDHLLIALCDYLKTIFPSRFLYRYSGDEFAIVVNDLKKLDSYVKKISHRLTLPWKALGNEYILNYSMSSIAYPEVAKTNEDIVKGLEYALSYAKEGKGNRYLPCTLAMLTEIKRKYLIIQRLKECVEYDCFEVVFQPIFDVNKKCFNHAEALVRLPQKEEGFISPGEFIPIAEETGFIVNLTYCVLRKTCQFVKDLLQQGIQMEGVSVNFSSVIFKQDNLQERVLEIIDSYDIPYSTIKIEITESILISNFDVVNDFIKNMTAKGIYFLLDDFGTGYSNFSSVLKIPFHTIKFDRSLIQNTIKHKSTEIFVTSLIASFKQLQFHVLAEGIENTEELALAIRNHCDFIQGFYYSRPLEKQKAADFILLSNKL